MFLSPYHKDLVLNQLNSSKSGVLLFFLYYEAAKLAANVVKRFNTKNFTTRKKHKIGDYFSQKVEFVRPIPGNASFHPLIINVLEKHAAS